MTKPPVIDFTPAAGPMDAPVTPSSATHVTIPHLEAGHEVHVRINERDYHGTLVSTGQITLSGKTDNPYTAPVPMGAPVRPDDDYIDLVMEVMPGPDSEFIEAHDASGKNVNAGQWIRNIDGTATLRIPGVGLAVQELAKMRAERDEADRRAGAAERREQLSITQNRNRDEWLGDAKVRAGYDRRASFDTVFDALLASVKDDAKMLDEFADIMKFYDVHALRQLVEAQATHIEKLQAKVPSRDEFPGSPRRG